MRRPIPRIEIKGMAGTGKSLLASLVASALVEHKISCRVIDESLVTDWKGHLSHFKGKTIDVQTVETKS